MYAPHKAPKGSQSDAAMHTKPRSHDHARDLAAAQVQQMQQQQQQQWREQLLRQEQRHHQQQQLKRHGQETKEGSGSAAPHAQEARSEPAQAQQAAGQPSEEGRGVAISVSASGVNSVQPSKAAAIVYDDI